MLPHWGWEEKGSEVRMQPRRGMAKGSRALCPPTAGDCALWRRSAGHLGHLHRERDLRGALDTPQVSLGPLCAAALAAWPWAVEASGLGGRGGAHSPSLPVSRLCPQPACGHGSGRRGDLHQRLGQPPRAAQSARQGGSGDHGHHQGRRWATMLERACCGLVPRSTRPGARSPGGKDAWWASVPVVGARAQQTCTGSSAGAPPA